VWHYDLSGRGKGGLSALGALGTAQLVVYAALAFWDGYHERPMVAMLLCLLAFVLYLGATAAAGSASGRAAFLAATVFGLAFRITLLPEPPFFSDDHFRYLWDGLVQLEGVNPYRYAPADPGVAGIDDALRAQVNHPDVPTIYPPLAQVVFALAALTGGGWIALKLVWLACDLAIAALLFRTVPVERRLQAWMVYWWSPLVIIEVAWSAHLDLAGVLFLVAALKLARGSPPRSARMGLALAAAGLVKYFAAALVPAAARIGRPGRVLAAVAVGTAVLYAPYAFAGRGMFVGLATFAESWRFNDGLFRVLAWITASPGVAKAVAAAVVLSIVIQSVRNAWTLERTAFWVTGAILMLSPTVHPWYLLWMVPLISIRWNRAWLYLSGSVFLAYYGLGTYRTVGVWPQPWWAVLIIYLPFYALLLADAWRGSWWQAQWEAIRQTKSR
jgi:hypothetical protein